MFNILLSFIYGEASTVIKGFIYAFIIKALAVLILLPILWYGAKWTAQAIVNAKIETAKSTISESTNYQANKVKEKINELKNSFNKDNNK